MASYNENFASKLDWAMPFQRTGKFPLDRTSIFDSYADALKYAKQDGTDNRALGGTSYIGQIITVYGNDQTGTSQEVAAYIITAVGESASLMKLAQTTATGDFASDIQALQTALSNLEIRVKANEDALALVDDKIAANKGTEYEFATATTTDGAIIITNKTDNTTKEVQVKGWSELKALASGRNKGYVYTNQNDESFIAAAGKTGSFKLGDIIYFTDKDMPDLWVGAVLSDLNSENQYYTFYELEATKVDLTGYIKETDADAKYATQSTVNTKANQSDLNALSTTVTTNKTDADAKHTELEAAIDKVADDLSKIDVSSQITAKINELDVAKVGGAENSYIKSIEQADGKITAIAATLPDYDSNAQEKADKALEDAKEYTDTQIGEVGDVTVKEYIDTEVSNSASTINETITGVAGRVSVLEGDTTDIKSRLSTAEGTITTHTTELTNLSTRVTTVEGKVTKLETDVSTLKAKVDSIEDGAQVNKIESIKIGGIAQTIDENKAVDITEISTDLLKTGSKTLVLDCLNADLSEVD